MLIIFAPLICSPRDTTLLLITAARLCVDINVDVSIQRGRWVLSDDLDAIVVVVGGRVGSSNAACNGITNSNVIMMTMDWILFRGLHTDPALMQAQSMHCDRHAGFWVFCDFVFHIIPIQAPGHIFQGM